MDCDSHTKATSVPLPPGSLLPEEACNYLCIAMKMKLRVPVLQPGDHELMFSRWAWWGDM